MPTVTQRIRNLPQPSGGYIDKELFKVIKLSDNRIIEPVENVQPSIVGLAVDYLSRFKWGFSKEKAFEVSLEGASAFDTVNEFRHTFMGAENDGIKHIDCAEELLSNIRDLDDLSIISACNLVGYDNYYRKAEASAYTLYVEDIKPDVPTIANIRTMVNRCIDLANNVGGIKEIGFTFSSNAYTNLVCDSDGDFLTKDTMWDLKVSKYSLFNNPRAKEWTLQLFVYYLLGCRSVDEFPEYSSIKKLGIFNPRLNEVYIAEVADIPQSVFKAVEKEVMGYRDKVVYHNPYYR